METIQIIIYASIYVGLVATVFSVLATMALFYFFILKNFK